MGAGEAREAATPGLAGVRDAPRPAVALRVQATWRRVEALGDAPSKAVPEAEPRVFAHASATRPRAVALEDCAPRSTSRPLHPHPRATTPAPPGAASPASYSTAPQSDAVVSGGRAWRSGGGAGRVPQAAPVPVSGATR